MSRSSDFLLELAELLEKYPEVKFGYTTDDNSVHITMGYEAIFNSDENFSYLELDSETLREVAEST